MAPRFLLNRLLCPSPLMFWSYTLPFIYWAYLILTSSPIIAFDSVGYINLAHILYNPFEWDQYFRSGPTREPLYSLVISLSMHIGTWLSISYIYILKTLSLLLLALTMYLIHQLLKRINAAPWVQAGAVLYTGFSPVLINSALCVYSEIVTFPLITAAVYFGWKFMDSLSEGPSGSSQPAWGLGLSLLGFTMTKGLGELLFPLFLCCLIIYGWQNVTGSFLSFIKRSRRKILIVLLIFYIPLLGFKSMNYLMNHHFTLTNRANINVYGNLVHRSQVPLNLTAVTSNLLTVPISYDLCSKFYPDPVCYQWSMRASDQTFFDREAQLNKLHLSEAEKNKILFRELLQALTTKPLEQTLYFLQEGLKTFFWETSQGPFVVYPYWLERLFNNPWIVMLMSLGIGLLCFLAFLISFTLLKNRLVLITLTLLVLLIILLSFVHILNRYAAVVAPLEILLMFTCCDSLIRSIRKPRV